MAACQHDVFQQDLKAFWVLQHSMEDSGMRSPEMAGGLSRAESGPAHARLFCAALEKNPVSHVEVSPWEKPVGLLPAETGGSSYACHGDS